MPSDPNRTRELLARATRGDAPSVEALFPLVYEQLRAIAHGYFGSENDAQTLQPTALVHEAFVKLAGMRTPPKDREHFLAIGAKAMREILIDAARRRKASKRAGDRVRVTLGDLEVTLAGGSVDDDVLALDEALTRLAGLDPQQAHIVELHYFGGMTGREVASMLGVSRNTVVRDLTMARAWLLQALDDRRGSTRA